MIEFEWDPAKNLDNQRKHGFSFEQAKHAFFNPHHTILSKYKEEVRFIMIGIIGNHLAAVVFTPRNGRIRIISVRKARKNEVITYKTYIENH